MKKQFLLIITVILILFSCLSQIKPNKVAEILPIQTKDTQLIRNGKPFRLIGVSIADPYYLDHEDNHFREDIFKELSGWDINVVRVPIHPGAWLAEEYYMEKYLDVVIQWAAKYNLYIILDWHAIGNPLNGISQALPEWKIEDFKPYDSSSELWESAWLKLSKRYGENHGVIFELFNEPVGLGDMEIPSELWTETLHNLIDKIRINAPNTLILVSGWKWTFDLVGFAFNPIMRNNVGYVAHVYASHDTGWSTSFGWVTNKYPLVITEWGFSPDVSEGIHYYGFRDKFGQRFYKYMEGRGASWLAWCFHPEWMPNMIKDWNYELTNQGLFIKQITTKEKNPPTLSIEYPKKRGMVSGIIVIKGKTKDDTGLLVIEAKIDDEKYQEVENIFDNTFQYSKWSYKLNTYKLGNGFHSIRVRAIDTSGNKKELTHDIEVKNDKDEIPPEILIESGIENKTLTGNNVIKTIIKDQSGIELIKACIDDNAHTCYDSSKISLTALYYGVFSKAILKDNELLINIDTTRLDNGKHSLNISADDLFGNRGSSQQLIFYTENDEYLISNCENIQNWNIYSGGGTTIEKKLDNGVEGGCMKVHYKGCSSGWWGFRKVIYRDYSKFTGVEFYIKGTSNTIRLQLKDNEYKCWVYILVPKKDWEKIRIPFKDLQYRGDWQKSGIPRNRDLKLKNILEISFIHTVKDQAAKGDLWTDEWKLY